MFRFYALILFPVLLILIVETPLTAQLFINEFMASNGNTIADEDGDYEDWLEIYNSGTETVNLQGYGLSDNPGNPYKWVFPEAKIEPGAWMVVWTSGKNKTVTGFPLHTGWSISAGGEDLVLTHPDGTVTDLIPGIAVPRDVSYGRSPDGSSTLYFFTEATPGMANLSTPYTGILDDPIISVVKEPDQSYSVSITHPNPQVDIHYSTNGRNPDINSILYQGEVTISELPKDTLMHIRPTPVEIGIENYGWIQPTESLPKALVVRAAAHLPGYLSSRGTSATYFEEALTFPTLSLIVDPDYFFDDAIGIYVPGNVYKENGFNWENPWGEPNANYFQRGVQWERNGVLEFYYPDGQHHRQNCGFRINGGGTRAFPQKSIRVYARSELGAGNIDFDVFQNGDGEHLRLILRNSGQDHVYGATMLKDGTIHELVSHLAMETQAYYPCKVYLNGEFWGIYNIRERIDNDYFKKNFQIEKDKLDLLEFHGGISEGSSEHYWETWNYIVANGLTEAAHYEHIQTRIDTDNFRDYLIANIYAKNSDWPGNNYEYWRYQNDSYQPDASYGKDGRWRWLFKDLDFSFGQDYDFNMMEHVTLENGPAWPNPDWSTFLIRKLFENEIFRQDFIVRTCDLLNTAFLTDRVLNKINENASRISSVMPEHIKRWGRPNSILDWDNNLQVMRDFAIYRPGYVRAHLAQHFNLEDETRVTLDVSDPSHGHIKINTVEISAETPGVSLDAYPWDGYYYQEIPLALEAIPAPGYRFSHWLGSKEGEDATMAFIPNLPEIYLQAVFEIDNMITDIPLHYWHFNDLPSGVLEEVGTDISQLDGGLITYPGSGDGYMDRVNGGTEILALPGVEEGRSLRVRNPSDTRDLIFDLPTTGYHNIRFNYAVTRTANGQNWQQVQFSVDNPPVWQILRDSIPVSEAYVGHSFDLTQIDGVRNNPDFKIKLNFLGAEASGTSGNNRFDNVLLTGSVLNSVTPQNQLSEIALFPNPSQGRFILKWNQDNDEPVTISIVNIVGQIVHEIGPLRLNEGTKAIPVELNEVTPGVYFVHIQTRDLQSAQTLKLIIH